MLFKLKYFKNIYRFQRRQQNIHKQYCKMVFAFFPFSSQPQLHRDQLKDGAAGLGGSHSPLVTEGFGIWHWLKLSARMSVTWSYPRLRLYVPYKQNDCLTLTP